MRIAAISFFSLFCFKCISLSFNARLTIPDLTQRLVPNIPKDEVLAHLLHKCPETIYSYHEHDSLLSHEEDLTEEEKEAAWREYEAKAKVYEARLQQQQSQETPAFLESEPSFNENDEYLDRFNGNDVNKPSTVDDNRASLQPQSAVGSVASFPWMSTQQKAGPSHTATTGEYQRYDLIRQSLQLIYQKSESFHSAHPFPFQAHSNQTVRLKSAKWRSLTSEIRCSQCQQKDPKRCNRLRTQISRR